MQQRYSLVLTMLALLCANAAVQAQDFFQDAARGENFYTIQKKYEEYWKGKNLDSVRGWKQFKRWEEFWAPRVYPTGEFPDGMQVWSEWQAMRERTRRNNDAMLAQKRGNELMNAPKWKLLGPTTRIPTGGGAGRVNSVTFDADGQIWLGTPGGGLWRSTSDGASWFSTTDTLPNLGVSDVAIHPTNPRIIFLATGDDDAGHTYSYGVLRSDDGGGTWKTTGLNFQVTQTRQISRILINPNNPSIMLAAASNGIWRSTTGGNTWTSVQGGNIADIEFKPNDPNIVYASSKGSSIFKSTNGGATWAAMTNGFNPSSSIRIELAVTPANPDYVYALVARGDRGFGGLFRSVDAGATWTRMSNSPNILTWDNSGNGSGGQGEYDLCIAVSQYDENTIYCGGVNIWKSTNGGTSWRINAHWQGNGAPYVHADIHDLIAVPETNPETIMAATDGGLFYTTNGGSSWLDLSNGLQILQSYRIGVNPANTNMILAGTQDNGTNRMQGTDWRQVYGGDGMETFFDANGVNAYCTLYYGSLFRSSNSAGSFPQRIYPISGFPQGPWVTPFTLNPRNNSIMYGAVNGAIVRTNNRGDTWFRVSDTTLFSGRGGVAFVLSAADTSTLYAVMGTGVFVSSNSGRTWRLSQTQASAAPSNLSAHRSKAGTVIATMSGYNALHKVFLTTDAGTSWTNITKTGLPNVPVNCAVFYADQCGESMIVGTDLGVFITTDKSNSWQEFGVGLPNVIVRDFELTGNLLRIGTFGRGVWELTINAAGPTAAFSVDKPVICAGTSVQYFDESSGLPGTADWEFEGGTPAVSQLKSPTITYAAAGTYKVKMRSRNGCGADSVERTNVITVVAPPPSPAIQRNGTTLTVPLVDGYTYQWFRNAFALNGATSNTYEITNVDARYSVRVTDKNGCVSVSDTIQIIVSVEENLPAGYAVNVYPNPTSSVFTISAVMPNSQKVSVRIYDATGRDVMTFEQTLQSSEWKRMIDLSNQPTGVYFIEVRSIQSGMPAIIRRIVKN
ncbi:MAG: T9SS type A sorting domain-containing protein [Candidatus Kapabacteria bacterium]|nr:T9SS type A sorting domain-containing protein [Candidatus Kapabacteria bacterium]